VPRSAAALLRMTLRSPCRRLRRRGRSRLHTSPDYVGVPASPPT
jgi:hypothetical protein